MAVGLRIHRRLISQRTVKGMRRAVDRLRGQQNTDRLISLGLEVGEGAFIARNAYLDPGYPWLITVGEQATLGPRVIVLAHDATMQRHLRRTLLGRVSIGKRAFIGAGAIILPGSNVGDDAVVGAGAVVRGDIPPGAVAIGNPAQIVSDIESMIQKHREASKEAPRWPFEGWTLLQGITQERMTVQRDALASGGRGYLEVPNHVRADELEA
jgi:maltose O-acetyltransferase